MNAQQWAKASEHRRLALLKQLLEDDLEGYVFDSHLVDEYVYVSRGGGRQSWGRLNDCSYIYAAWELAADRDAAIELIAELGLQPELAMRTCCWAENYYSALGLVFKPFWGGNNSEWHAIQAAPEDYR